MVCDREARYHPVPTGLGATVLRELMMMMMMMMIMMRVLDQLTGHHGRTLGLEMARNRSLSRASEALEMSSRRKISLDLYSELMMMSIRRLTSAWNWYFSPDDWIASSSASVNEEPSLRHTRMIHERGPWKGG
jgi:hypothetical protein